MRFTKRIVVTAAVLLVSAGAALAAGPPSGSFRGAVRWYNTGQKASNKFDVTATFQKGKLTGLKGQGNPGFIPYSAQDSTSTYCGAANTYDGTTDVTISPAKKVPSGFDWAWVIKPKQTANVYGWYTVTLAGSWISSTKAKTEIRFLQHHLPDKGRCDSGQMPMTLRAS